MDTIWNDGPPPSIGWWPTLMLGYEWLRWWDGACWSFACKEDDTAEEAAKKAARPSIFDNDQIQWSARPFTWPQRSRT